MKVFIETETLTALGNAIREKGGTTEELTTSEMVVAIGNIQAGGGEYERAEEVKF